jgi:ABC-type glycerol-3-phosphate transport system permease component
MKNVFHHIINVITGKTVADRQARTGYMFVLPTFLYVEYTLVCAGAIISMLPLVIMFLFLQRWVMQSMVMAGVKG